VGRLVLTKEEKRIVLFVVSAFLLGLAVKFYRDRHPQPVQPGERKPLEMQARP
jgi:hypothetical protein